MRESIVIDSDIVNNVDWSIRWKLQRVRLQKFAVFHDNARTSEFVQVAGLRKSHAKVYVSFNHFHTRHVAYLLQQSKRCCSKVTNVAGLRHALLKRLAIRLQWSTQIEKCFVGTLYLEWFSKLFHHATHRFFLDVKEFRPKSSQFSERHGS
jgi:hypothetical protein